MGSEGSRPLGKVGGPRKALRRKQQSLGSESVAATAGPWARPCEASGIRPWAGAGAGAWRTPQPSAGSGAASGGLDEDQDLGRITVAVYYPPKAGVISAGFYLLEVGGTLVVKGGISV